MATAAVPANLVPPTASSSNTDNHQNSKKQSQNSLLSRARNSTINLAALATGAQKFTCSASANTLWHPTMGTPLTPATNKQTSAKDQENRSHQWRDTIAGELGGEADAFAARVIDYTVQSTFDTQPYQQHQQPTIDDRLPPVPPSQPQPQQQQQHPTSAPIVASSTGDKQQMRKTSSTKEKSRRHKEAERVEKLRLLVSYLRSGSGHSLLSPVTLEADEIELAEKYKLHRVLCEQCLQETEQQQQQMQEKQLQQPQHQSLKSSAILGSPTQCMSAASLASPNSGSEGSTVNQSVGNPLKGMSSDQRASSPMLPISTTLSSSLDPTTGPTSAGIVINIRRSSGQFQQDADRHESNNIMGSGLLCGLDTNDLADITSKDCQASSMENNSALLPGASASLVPTATSTPNGLAQGHQLPNSASSPSFDQQPRTRQTKTIFDALSPPQQAQVQLLCYRCQKPTGQTRSSMVSSANLTATASVASDLGISGQNVTNNNNVDLFHAPVSGTACLSGKMPVSSSITNGSIGGGPITTNCQLKNTNANNQYNVLPRRTRNASSIPHIGNVSWVLRHSISDPGSNYERSPLAQHVTGCCAVGCCHCSSQYSSITGHGHLQCQPLQLMNNKDKQIQNQTTSVSSQLQSNSVTTTSNGSHKLFYIDDNERKDGDIGAHNQIAATRSSSPFHHQCSVATNNNSNASSHNVDSANNQEGQQQKTSTTCICDSKNYYTRGGGLASYCSHERSKASISSSEALKDSAIRSWSSEMFLSYTPTVPILNNNTCNGCHHGNCSAQGQNSSMAGHCEHDHRQLDSDSQTLSTFSKSATDNQNLNHNQQFNAETGSQGVSNSSCSNAPQSPSLSTLDFRGDSSPRNPYHDGETNINGLMNTSFATKSTGSISQPPTPASNNASTKSTSAWTNPQNLASWIDSEVNSLVSDLEAEIHLVKSEKINKSGSRRKGWLVGVSSSNSSNNARDRRNSSGAHST